MASYTITYWQDRPEFGGPVFHASIGNTEYRVSGINYAFPAHDGEHRLHEVIVWRDGENVYEVHGTANAINVFHDYLREVEGINV